jgi:hypothetical protein
MGKPAIPDPNSIGPDTPLRLEIAAAIAFPDGGMTASGLRKEHTKGRLEFERIANKDFVTLKQIEEMRKRCALSSRPVLSPARPARDGAPCNTSSTEETNTPPTPVKMRPPRRYGHSQDLSKTSNEQALPANSATVVPIQPK